MNRYDVIGKILRKHFYISRYLEIETCSSFDLTIFLDLVDLELKGRRIR